MIAIRNLTRGLSTERKYSAEFETCPSIALLCSNHRTFKRRINMFRIFRTFFTLLFSLSLAVNVFAQTRRANGQAANPIITATTSNGRVRYTSLGEVNQTRLQVFAADGRQVYDSDLRLGNLIDWSLLDEQGQRLTDGSYAFLITVREFSGTLTQKYGTALLEGDHVSLQQTAREEMPQPQALALQANKVADVLGAVDRIGAAALAATPVVSTEAPPVIEQAPFVKKTASATTTLTSAAAATDAENLTGTGNQDRLAKWTDNAGTLGDSVVAESSGNIGIGTTSPTHKLDVQSLGANGAIRSVNETFGVRGLISEQHSTNVVGAVFVGLKSRGTLAAPTAVVPGDFGAFFSNKWYDGTSYVQSGAFGFTVDGPVSTGVVPTRLSFVTSTTSNDGSTAHGVERMTILSGGNVGIGTTTPSVKLDVSGDLNVTGNANILGNIAAKYQDVAEWVEAREPMEPGTVVSLDTTRTDAVTPSRHAYDSLIAGVVSAQPGVILGEPGELKVMVAMSGRVPVKVDASRYPIRIGDLLVASNRPGVAMRSRPIRVGGKLIHRPGTIIGKALAPLAKGRGEILVLLSPQ